MERISCFYVVVMGYPSFWVDYNQESPSLSSGQGINLHLNPFLSFLFLVAIDQEYLVSVSAVMRHCLYDSFGVDSGHFRLSFLFSVETHRSLSSYDVQENDWTAS